jgi:hypothetical protein
MAPFMSEACIGGCHWVGFVGERGEGGGDLLEAGADAEHDNRPTCTKRC